MRRVVITLAAVALVPLVGFSAASAQTDTPDCTTATTAPGTPACEDTTTSTTSTTSTPVTSAPTTTIGSATTTPPTAGPTSTVDPNAPTTTDDPASSTTTPATAAPTTTIDPNASTTTVDPNVTTTTIDPNASTTTVDPNVTTTTLAPAATVPAEDIETDPVVPPAETPGGRTVVAAGAVDVGQVRPIAFPVAGPITYVNDWGACRDACARAHKGNDLIGDRQQPILAMHDGVIDHLVDHPTAGFGVAIRDDEGWEYHVYHMNNDTPGTDDGADPGTWRLLPGIVPGATVTAGQQIGWMGDSGNSEGSVPHAHVEIHRPDGTAINPYWSLRSSQRASNCAVGTVGQPAPGAEDPATAPIGATTPSAAAPAGADWLSAGWSKAELPVGWTPLTVTGGHPGSGAVAARFWISVDGFTPVDAAANRVGDPRYDDGVNCANPAESEIAPIPAELGAILATIRAVESGGDYGVSITTSSASGAYAFLDSSWGGYGGYARAKDAPPAVQDAKAAELASQVLARNGGDVSAIPVSWYIGHVPVGDEWDTIPVPEAGNRLTPREYQSRWMARYTQLIGEPEAWVTVSNAPAVDTSATCRTVLIDVGTADDPQYVLTQAQSFLTSPDGRAVPNGIDACDPGRALAGPVAPIVAVRVPPVALQASGPAPEPTD